MTTTWKNLTPDEKREAVRGLLAEGKTYSEAAGILGAPGRNSIASVVDNSRRWGNNPIQTPNLEGRPHKDGPRRPTDRKKNANQIVQEKARRARAKAQETAGEDTSFQPDDRPSYDRAWVPLEGSSPVRLADHVDGCRWPCDTGESVARFCNEPATHGRYCERHNAIGTRPEPERARRTVAGKIKAFNL